MTKLCDECETVAHCSKHGCIPKRDFWEGYVPEPVKPAQQEPVAFLVDDDLYYPEEIDWESLKEQGHTVAPLYTKDQL